MVVFVATHHYRQSATPRHETNLSKYEAPTARHTPGPWYSDTESWTDAADIYDSSNHEIAQLTPFAAHRLNRGKHELDVERSMEEICANARLMAAAPELLAACKAAMRALPIAKWKKLNLQLEAAIRKAGGM